MQDGLEIETTIIVIWENKKNLKIFAKKVDSVQFTLRDPYQDDTKKNARNQLKGERCMCVYIFRRRIRKLN